MKEPVNSPPKVSIIVPTYNRPQMLREALQSILKQDYHNLEIVVVNDGGPDVTSAFTSLRGRNEIVYLRHDVNKGSAAARNTGLKAARGKYIAYLDDDDVFLPDHLETLVSFLQASGYKVAYSDAYRAHQRNVNGGYRVVGRDVPYSYDFDYDRILIGNFIPVLCFMHEKSCLEKVGYFDEELPALEDWDFWIRMSRRYRIGHIKKVTCEFRWREDQSRTEWQLASHRIYAKYRAYSKMPVLERWFERGFVSRMIKAFTLYNLYARRWGYVAGGQRMFRYLSKPLDAAFEQRQGTKDIEYSTRAYSTACRRAASQSA